MQLLNSIKVWAGKFRNHTKILKLSDYIFTTANNSIFFSLESPFYGKDFKVVIPLKLYSKHQ